MVVSHSATWWSVTQQRRIGVATNVYYIILRQYRIGAATRWSVSNVVLRRIGAATNVLILRQYRIGAATYNT